MSADGTLNDNDPKVDNHLEVVGVGQETSKTDIANTANSGKHPVDDDTFVCGKCNKVFKDLSEYLEHKVRDENYRISHARSKVNKRLVIPHLVVKKKRNTRRKGVSALRSNDISTNSSTIKGNKELVNPNLSIQVNDRDGKNCLDTGSKTAEHSSSDLGIAAEKQKGNKQKLDIQVGGEPGCPEKDNACQKCDKKFRRAAALRWHMKYDHKSKDDDSDVSDDSDKDFLRDDASHTDEDFNLDGEQEQENDHDLETNNLMRNIVSMTSVTARDPNKVGAHKAGDGNNRPFVCEICGRGFKELPVYKAHGIVHSQERKFVCTVSGCPYGFKTKGCLVRHMRRHTGERPFDCEKCGRSFTESGALSRHLKSRRNCAMTPDTHYPRYKKRWSYHPNIEAVIDPQQRESHAMPEPLETQLILTDNGLVLSETVDSNTVVREETDEPLMMEASEEVESSNKIPKQSTMSTSINNQTPTQEGEDEMAELRRNSDRTGLKETQCHVCKKDFPQAGSLEMHLHTHLAYQPTQCGFCHFLATNRDEMHQHVVSLHGESLSDTESFLFAMKGEASRKDQGKQGKKETLREALLAVKQLYGLKASNKSTKIGTVNPSTTGSLQCLVCSKTFKGVNYMRQHMRMHTGDRPFKCEHCNRSFTSRDVLKKHMYVHVEQRDFKCGECGKMFKRLSHVQQHLRIHSQERHFRCTICEKLFKTHNSLKVHLRTHTNINPYKCQVCNRHFRERGSLQRHMRLHTGERPFACQHCNRRFAEQGTLSRHLKAKVPCSVTRDTDILPASSNATMLAQFSSVVADTQEYILPAVQEEELPGDFVMFKETENGSKEVVENVEIITEQNLSENKEINFQYDPEMVKDEAAVEVHGDSTEETLQIYDATTGESLFITGERSVIEMVKSQQVALESADGGLGLDEIRNMLLAAEKQMPAESTNEYEPSTSDVEAVKMLLIKSEENELDSAKEANRPTGELIDQTASSLIKYEEVDGLGSAKKTNQSTRESIDQATTLLIKYAEEDGLGNAKETNQSTGESINQTTSLVIKYEGEDRLDSTKETNKSTGESID